MSSSPAKPASLPAPVPLEAGWLVRNSSGYQFSTHPKDSRTKADEWAERIGGTVEWYEPIQSHYWDAKEGAHYDH